MIFNPAKPTQFVVSVQHPSSTDLGLVPHGFGDALWAFDLKDIVAPPCKPSHGFRGHGWDRDRDVQVCAKDNGKFVRELERAARRR